MKREDTTRTLLNTISIFTNRDWGSSEKNSEATELTRRIERAVTMRDDTEMEKLVAEIQYFMSATFVLFKRMERLVKRHGQKVWQTSQDNETWGGLIERTSVIIKRKDSAELVEIAPRIIAFLRRRNEHVIAQSLEDALKTPKPQR
jgi:hypothetical protein